MHCLYIIYSQQLRRYYVGETPNAEIRLIQHNTHYFKTNFTKATNDWKLLLKYPCKSREEAVSRKIH
ncbi:GIY-YIG nuclease family protein [Aequorivita viscosa]|nr:GIY-YIG nuclease family protein [Aequorivita viscosa]